MISTNVLLPDALVSGLGQYLDTHKGATWDSAISAAVALLLLQAGNNDPDVQRVYLEALLGGGREVEQ